MKSLSRLKISNVILRRFSKVLIMYSLYQRSFLFQIMHAGIGLVPSNVIVTTVQVFSRIMVVNGVILATPYTYAAASLGLPLALTAWSITEILRYSYYFINLISNVPYLLVWMR